MEKGKVVRAFGQRILDSMSKGIQMVSSRSGRTVKTSNSRAEIVGLGWRDLRRGAME